MVLTVFLIEKISIVGMLPVLPRLDGVSAPIFVSHCLLKRSIYKYFLGETERNMPLRVLPRKGNQERATEAIFTPPTTNPFVCAESSCM